MTNAYADELLERSTRLIEDPKSERDPRAMNPIDGGLADFGDGVALITSFSHVVVLAGASGVNLVDTSSATLAPAVQASLRRWSADPVDTMVYTHGHLDHVGGAPLFAAEAVERRGRRPRVIAHVAVADRFHRYDATEGYNAKINSRQFRGQRRLGARSQRWTVDWVWPDVSFSDRLQVDLGGRAVVLHHDRGETDDHAWLWMPDTGIICGGDFLTWVFPNAGNPQKVQRYPGDWARALRAMTALEPELFLPAHGLPIRGRDRIARVLVDVATALESLVEQTLTLMNAGAPLDEVLRGVQLDPELAGRPYLQATYDEPEFVIRNIWRLYGGWWDGDPSQLKPAASAELASEVASLAGGANRLAARGAELSGSGEHRLACHLVEMAVRAEPGNVAAHAARAQVYRNRRDQELSLMARSIYGEAADQSAAASDGSGVNPADR